MQCLGNNFYISLHVRLIEMKFAKNLEFFI